MQHTWGLLRLMGNAGEGEAEWFSSFSYNSKLKRGRSLTVAPLYCKVTQVSELKHHLIPQQRLPKLQMVSFQDGGAVQLRQRITRPGEHTNTACWEVTAP